MTEPAAITEPGPLAIRTSKLTKHYGDLVAVDQLDLDVRRGEIFGLLGPNGAGKSTTAGLLTCRVIPTSGTAEVEGIDAFKSPALLKQLIGVVPQSNTLDRSLSVYDNLYHHGRFFGLSAKQARAATDEQLARFRLTERAKAPVFALSGGLAQRLMVARAVLHSPAVLFLDEPTSGLDPQSRLALWDVLRELHAAGQTILLTTHYMEEADALCDRVAIMDHGRLLALDTPAGLKATYGTGTVITVSATRGNLAALAIELGYLDGVDEATTVAEGVRVQLSRRDGMVAAIVSTAERMGVDVRDVAIAQSTLETVFIHLTGRDLRE